MNDVMRKRIQRKLENLPDEVVYQVVDYLEFLERKYGTDEVQASPLQKLAEGVEDVLRASKVPVAAIKGTMQAVEAAGKVASGVSAAGKAVVDEIQKVADVATDSEAPKLREKKGAGKAADAGRESDKPEPESSEET
ncbi:MAG: hypothetical protein O7D29_10665 [Gemmatimonadetes bacterium]|nr:hypothetical protein [Gemmatimonadota bacterium]